MQSHANHARVMIYGNHTKGMETLLKALEPSQRHEDYINDMETITKAWRLCQMLEGHAKDMETMPLA